MDIEHVDIDIKPGHYRDRCGEWQSDRRELADRRTDPFANRKYSERRSVIRRISDREMLDYLKKAAN